MAVQVLQDWAAVKSGSADPSGSFTVPTGTNRTLIMVMTTEYLGTHTASAAIGGVAAVGQGHPEFPNGGGDYVGVKYWYWDETAVAAISAAGSSNVSFSDDAFNVTKRHWSYATFGSTDSTTPITVNSSARSAVASATPILVATPGETGDHTILIVSEEGTRGLRFGPGTAEHWDQSNAGSQYRSGLADGAWSSAVSFASPSSNFGEDMVALAIVVNALTSVTITGTGSADGLLPTLAGIGERTITGSASCDVAVVTVAGVGERVITGSASCDVAVVSVAGVGERVITADGSAATVISTVAGTGTAAGSGIGDFIIPIPIQATINNDPIGKSVNVQGL